MGILGRDAVWTKTSSVAKLSPYLCVQYMRFFWKATPDTADHTGVKCKNRELLESCGLDKDFQGHYELFAIVTHKGRSADGGHYMGWVKREDGSWLVFDDDLVSESSWEFVQGLKGGGDEHMSYLQFYRAKKGEGG